MTVSFQIDGAAFTALQDRQEPLSVGVQQAISAAVRVTHELPAPNVTYVLTCSDVVAIEIRIHFEQLEGKFKSLGDSSRARSCYLAATAIAQELTKGLKVNKLT